MIDENPFPRRVNDDPVKAPTGLTPQPVILTGRRVRLEPLDLDRHIGPLYRIGHESEIRRAKAGPIFLGGRFRMKRPSTSSCESSAELRAMHSSPFARRQRRGGRDGGLLGQPARIRRYRTRRCLVCTRLPAHARRDGRDVSDAHLCDGRARLSQGAMALQCDERQKPPAAKRLGFRFEGIFFGNMVSKGRNRDTAWYSILDSEWPGLESTIEAWLDPSNFDVEGKQLQSLSVMTAAR